MSKQLFNILIQAFFSFFISLFSAWLAVKFSQRKFREERLWDRKVIAYERVIDAFHKSKKFSSEHMDIEYAGRTLDEERDKELRRLSHDAMEEIRRAADVGSFTLSTKAIQILADYKSESSTKGIVSWGEYLEHDYTVTTKYMKLFIEEAKFDLGNST